MDPRSRNLFSDAIRQEAMRRYGIAPDDIKLLDGFESFIYEYQNNGDARILRISHSLHRGSGEILGEMDWLAHLSGSGVPCATPVLSENGQLVEVIPLEDSHFTAAAFEKAPGRHSKSADLTPKLFRTWGRLIGQIHRVTKSYRPVNPAAKRPSWADDVQDVESWFPASEGVALEKFREIVAHLNSLLQDSDSFGLIHFDAHQGNFFVDNGRITLFDFDDCMYSWFVNDIAIVLFYVVTNLPDGERDAFALHFFTHFWQGYREENELGQQWLAQIPCFLKMRELDLYAVIHRSFDVDNLDHDPWVKNFMVNRRQRIANDVPYLNFDPAKIP